MKDTMQKMKQKCDDTACKENEMRIAQVQVSKFLNVNVCLKKQMPNS